MSATRAIQRFPGLRRRASRRRVSPIGERPGAGIAADGAAARDAEDAR